MAEVLKYRNPKKEYLQKEFEEYLKRSEALEDEYHQVETEIENCVNEGKEPSLEISNKLIELIGLRIREERIGDQIIREMNGGHHPKDDIDHEKIFREAWEDVYGFKVL